MSEITTGISTSRIEDPSLEIEIEDPSPESGKCIRCTYRANDNPFCSIPAGLFTMAIGVGAGYGATNLILDAYKNRDIKIMFVGGLFDFFALAIFGAGGMIIANRCASFCKKDT